MNEKVFKILSIDGGGIKGLYSSTILEHFEKKFNCSISDYFNMLCGTSTGGLIALALSLKISAKEISEFYINKGNLIFPPKSKICGILSQLFSTKYSDEPLKVALEEVFGENKIGASNNLLCIPCYDVTDARNWVFKFDNGELGRDNKANYVDVALATTAAPSFFPIAEISYYDKKQFVDGGIWANNPVLVGLIEAIKFHVGEGKKYNAIKIISISSLTNTGGKPIGMRRKMGLMHWRNDLFETALTGQSLFTHYFMETFSKVSSIPIEYIRIPSVSISSSQESLVKLDNACENSINLIRGKGNDVGDIWEKKSEIQKIFSEKKH